jgi:hypothetical protein
MYPDQSVGIKMKEIYYWICQFYSTRYLGKVFSTGISIFILFNVVIAQNKMIQKETNPITIPIEKGKLDVDLDPQGLDISLGINQPQTIFLYVKNTGNVSIEKLEISSHELLNSATQNRVVFPGTVRELDLKPEKQGEISIDLPQPVFAGSYTGGLKILINETKDYTIPITIHTKGPNVIGKFRGLPLLLFVITAGCGLWLSFVLEDWFGLGGLMRGQITLNLQQSERHLHRILDRLKELLSIYPSSSLNVLKLRFEETLSELRRAIEGALDTPEERLLQEADRFALTTNRKKLHWDVIQMIVKQYSYDTSNMRKLLTKIESIPTNLSLELYREKLQMFWYDATNSEAENASVTEKIPPIVRPKNLGSRLNGMAWLYRFGIWLVAFVLIWEIFFANNLIFGALLDYLGVFLFTVCFTQTCTQFLSRFRSSYTRAK